MAKKLTTYQKPITDIIFLPSGPLMDQGFSAHGDDTSKGGGDGDAAKGNNFGGGVRNFSYHNYNQDYNRGSVWDSWED